MDNSDFRQKIMVRQKGLVLLPRPRIITDMFAGEGHVSSVLWSKLNSELTCIEKDKSKLSKIEFDCEKIHGDNINYIDLAAKSDIVDMDAYGLVFKKINMILDKSIKTQLIFFTESNPFSKYINKTIEELMSMDITSFWIEKSNQSKVYYGYIYRKV